jgi:exosome complex RNA-binding protein Rrp4
LETETLLCCETTSTKKDFSGLTSMLKSELETTIRTGIILTSQQLIWVLKGDQSTARLTAANLREIQARPYTSLLAQKFCEEVKKAISIINPEIQRRFPYWMGG